MWNGDDICDYEAFSEFDFNWGKMGKIVGFGGVGPTGILGVY